MINTQMIQFEHKINYLISELNIQKNNKQILLDIINNIESLLNNSSNDNYKYYQNLLDDANQYLTDASNNIICIEQYCVEINNIIKEVSNLISDKTNITQKTYVNTFSNLKNIIMIYDKKIQNIEAKLISDNTNINEFITENNFNKLKDYYIEETEFPIVDYDVFNGFSNINNENYLTFTDDYIIENLKNDIIEASQNLLNSHYIKLNLSNPKETIQNEITTTTENVNNYIYKNQDINNNEIADNYIENTQIQIINNNDLENIESSIINTDSKKLNIIENNSNKINTINQGQIAEKKSNDICKDNNILLISEKLQKIYLPYTITELKDYIKNYPNSYSSLKDVVEKEFILPFSYFNKHPSKSRFKETFNLLRNRDYLANGLIESISYSFKLLNKRNLNPAIIAACKSKYELDSYLYYLDSNKLDKFRYFKIIYEVNPI